MRFRLRRILVHAFGALALLAVAATLALRMQAREGGSFLADLVSRAASSPDMKVNIGAFEDPLSAHPLLRDIAIADRDGVFLKIDEIALDWSPSALFALRVDIEKLAIGAIDVARRPAPARATTETPKSGGGFALPNIPVRIRLGRLALETLALGEPVLGVAATFAATGDAALDNGAHLSLDIRRLDAPGSITAKADVAADGHRIALSVIAREPEGGAIARLAALPGLPPVDISLTGEGTLDDFAAHLAAEAGETIGAEGAARLMRKDAARRLDFDMGLRLAPLLPAAAVPLFEGTTQLAGAATLRDDGALEADIAIRSRTTSEDAPRPLDLSIALKGVPKDERLSATLSGTLAAPALAAPALERLLGRRLALGGALASLPGGGLRFEGLSLQGDHLAARIDGAAMREALDVDAKIDIADLRPADPRLSGRAEISVKATGSADRPNADFAALLEDARLDGHAIRKLALHGAARDLTGALSASATLDGAIDDAPARGKLNARKDAGWTIDNLDLAIGRATLRGALALDAQGLASGRLSLAAPDLDDLSALALRELSGALQADIRLDASQGAQNMSIEAQGTRIRAADAAIERLSAKLTGHDLLRRPALDGSVAIDSARVAGKTISRARLIAAPAGAATSLDLAVDAEGFVIASRAGLTPGERMRLDIRSLTAQRAGKRIALAAPASVMLGAGAVELKGLAFALGAGRLDIDGTIGERLDLTARARAIPLSIASIADTNLSLDGALDAEAHIAGDKKSPSGDWKIKIAKLSAPQLRTNGLPPLDMAAHGSLAGARTSLDADIALGAGGRFAITGSAPIDAAGALDLRVKGEADAKLADTALAANGQSLRGKANVDLRIAGSASAPALEGAVTLVNGSFADPLNGVYLDHIDARLDGRGREIAITRLTALTKNGGQIAATGHIAVEPQAGMPGAIRIKAKNAQLASTDLVSATADLDLDMSGALARAAKVSGRVTLTTMEVNVPDRLPASFQAPRGAVHISPRDFAKEMLALEAKEKARAAKRAPFDATIDLALLARNRIFVRGRGIDAEFGGELKLSGSIQKPAVNGAFDLRRGKLQLLTQRIDITRGKLTFAGGLVPQLDFSAETTASDVTAKIGVSGPASLPSFAFSSTPELPQDEVLSRLLFAKASGSLSAFQAVQLATALAQFSGAGTGVDAFEKMRKALGVDSLDLEAGGSSGPTVGASRYISDNISVGVRTGAKPEQTAVGVGVDVTKNVRVKGETRVDGKSSLGLGVEWEY
ncbi:translocation/assembly module TamB domain-containing protein [Methylosinus sp. Ce-a6]|uniref:translocation/assembly module TamB domain-containing protein n=1 Tax=Methylosinus sp. Ce-a6 TaxID=2172005 RepID=UPI00135ABA57|nr:translocation/assembly module TamB domain-containing protein [Methylosinus sp. Ce-a6]